ncbi:glycosyltransferase family 2 protein [Chitinophaga caseinilytica]|uniref:glycosyltransferase family 2 protein n=1 Tax=Chitinophaga caseinilytica TaxID=2267521 RepID=UPI003C2EB09D
MRELKQAPQPTRSDMLSLRLMIAIGTLGLCFFLYCLLRPTHIGHPVLYWMFVSATVFACLRILHEWYHYLFISVPKPKPGNRQFSVDILTTFCPGEPYEMIVQTLEAMQAVTYPHTSWLCDEADDPYLKEVCRKLGVRHVTRNHRTNAKAGNINNALQFATGELCVILDPDHIPSPDLLDPIVPFFNDENIGYVQIVQAYYNLGDSLIAKGAAQQTFHFYGPMMMTMNRYGTVLAIGANCTFRRAALDSIGGHAAGLAEDMHTAMQLHAKGWKSAYLPAVLTEGRVPSTLSAYYKQQLKWARGSLELLFVTYPKLFRKFTWAQRLHYGTAPLHYLSGLIFGLNFIVPVLALSMGIIPFKMDLVLFALAGLPFLVSILAIRHFVQRWVMGRGERGNHVLGGVLLIGTWWVHIVGLVYTIIRKKVPYIPTPKDDQEKDNWILNLPNIIVAVCSLTAIVYGLYIDWNPYTWIMAGIAGINFLVMSCNIAISRQKDVQEMRTQFRVLRNSFSYYRTLKQYFWNFRHGIYAGLRQFAFPIMLLMAISTLYLFGSTQQAYLSGEPGSQAREPIFYTGVFQPSEPGGITRREGWEGFQREFATHADIVSLYIPWGDGPQSELPFPLAEEIYRNGSAPMITWEPWASGFAFSANDPELARERKVMSRITAGVFDGYVKKFARQVRALNRPVFIRFAHEADNPAYPWSPEGGNTAGEAKNAWRHVHDLFQAERAYNAVWVWNPWKPEAVEPGFPGRRYVDWIGVTMLNYDTLTANGKDYTFAELYAPFRRKSIFRSGLPVMVAEGGLLRGERQKRWMEDAAKSITGSFREVQAFVVFNSAFDKNVPPGANVPQIDWQLQDGGDFFRLTGGKPGAAAPLKQLHFIQPPVQMAARPRWTDTLRGMQYQKGGNWFRNLHTLTRAEVVNDFREMRAVGVNTVRRYGPGAYDRNVLVAAAETGIGLHYGFWLPPVGDALADAETMQKKADAIVAEVGRMKHHPEIKAWSLANTAFKLLQYRFVKPAYLYQQKAYTAWLRALVQRIRETDPGRPVTIDVDAPGNLAGMLQYLADEIPQAAAFGVVLPPGGEGLVQLKDVAAPWFLSATPVQLYATAGPEETGVFVAAWQDEEATNRVTFNGLLDVEGRHKPDWHRLRAIWHPTLPSKSLPPVNILRPAVTASEGKTLEYRALILEHGNWRYAVDGDVTFEWVLVRLNREGKAVRKERLGKGAVMKVEIPFNPAAYRLHVSAAKGSDVSVAAVTLNTPI